MAHHTGRRARSSAVGNTRFFLGLLLSTISLGLAGACGDDTVPVDTCVGGVIVDGKCEGKCDPSLCVENNTCIGNRCRLKCTSHAECFSPGAGNDVLQECTAKKEDSADGLEDGADVFVCAESPKNKYFGWLCPFGAEQCDDPNDPNDWVCPDGTPCESGAGSESCSAEECRPLTCVTTGQGDAEAYCSSFDCSTDADCGPGMYCGVRAQPNPICGVDGKGDPELDCVEPSAFAANGATFQEGPISLLRNTCLKREPCAPCANDVDCTWRGDMNCVQIDQRRACSARCGETNDCNPDQECFEGFCLPKSFTCEPPKDADPFCFNCLNDLECGGTADNSIACVETSNGQRACFDLSFPNTCDSDSDCPKSPSGISGECLDEGDGVGPGDSVYQRCYFPFFSGPGAFQCWKE